MFQKLKKVIKTYPAEVIFGLIAVAILATNVLLFATMSYGTENLAEARIIAYVHNEETGNTTILGWDTLNYHLVTWESQDYKHFPLKVERLADGGVRYTRESITLEDGLHIFPTIFDLVVVNDYDGNTNTVETSLRRKLIAEIKDCLEERSVFYQGEYCTSSGVWNSFMEIKRRPADTCVSTYDSGMQYTSDNHIASGSYSKWPKTEITKTFWGYQITITPYVDRVWLDDGIAIYKSNGDPLFAVTDSDEQLEPGDPRAQAMMAEASQLGINWSGSPTSTFNVLFTGEVISTGCTIK